MAENIQEVDAKQFKEILGKTDKPVILDFYSTECPPCEALAPKFEAMASMFGTDITFLKIFRQGNKELAAEYGVSSSPTLLFFNEKGERLNLTYNGGIRKKEILHGIRELISDDRFDELMSRKEIKHIETDLAVIGAGPAGLTAAIYAAQGKVDTLVLDEALPGGQVSTTHLIANFPGTEKPMAGWELAHRMEQQTIASGAKIMGAVDVTGIEFNEGAHKIHVDDDTVVTAKSIILAMGAEPRRLGVKGEVELKGKGISYCATCDGKFYEGKEVVVIGGGNSAVEESLYLTRFATKVTIVHQFDELQANKTAQEKAFAHEKIEFVFSHEPRIFEIDESGKMKVTIENMKNKGEHKVLETDGVFVFVGMVPNTTLVDGRVKQNQWKYIETDEDMQTNLPGVYAVGDIRSKKIRQAATAVGDGCIGAVMAERYIEQLESKEHEESGKDMKKAG